MTIAVLIASISALACVGSLVFDVIVFRWHVRDRQRFERDEKREARLERRVSHVRADIKAGRPPR